MTQKERVQVIRAAGYCGYNKAIDSYCVKPEKYGVQRVPAAERLIAAGTMAAPPKKEKRSPFTRLTARRYESAVDLNEFHRLRKKYGYPSFNVWLNRRIDADYHRWKAIEEKERSPADAVNTDEATENICSTIINEKS